MRGASVTGWASAGLLVLELLTSCAPADRTRSEPADPGVPAGIQAHLAAREYHASENGQGLQAPNRAHNLRTYFEPNGIRVVDRTAAGSPQLLELELAGIGRGSELQPVPVGSVHAEDARVEIRRPGLVEWFVNGPDGLEQGFTLAEKPAGDGRLVLELQLEGAQAKRRGQSLVLETPTGRKLAYGKLAASDARGERLAAQLDLRDAGRIALTVDDDGAQYPIAIDPLLTETADTQLESDAVSALFGESVASAGDVNGDGYGDVIVGAPNYDDGQDAEGAAFIFHGSASGLPDGGIAIASTRLESDQPHALMGESVASAGDVNGDGYDDVIVSARAFDNGFQLATGAAFVFLGSASGVADANPITASTRLKGDQVKADFGCSVASAGDVNGDGYDDVIVGAYDYANAEADEGAAFVFLGSASGVADGNPASAHARLESAQPGASMGWSVASAGDVNGDGYDDVIVGDPFHDSAAVNGGAAFVFLGSASGIANGNPSNAASRLESNQTSARLGYSVASAGDVNGDGYGDVIVGVPGYGGGGRGAAFVFLGSATGVPDGNPTSAHARLESTQTGGYMGTSVASAGDVNGDGYADVIVGANYYANGQPAEGAAFVFLGSASGVADGDQATAYAQLEIDKVNANLGFSVASAGDVNGDGYADVIVGARNYQNPEFNEGTVLVYHGGATGIVDGGSADAASRLESDQAHAQLGTSVASAGDVNGDGYGDAIVGAPLYDDGQADEGAAFVFHGSASGVADAIPITASTRLEGDQVSANFGRSVASAGDVNGDGYADVIVGAPFYENPDNPHTDEGAAFLFLGSASGVADGNPTNAHAQLESDQAFANFGWSVASAGDVNGDSYADVIVGAWQYDSPLTSEGAAFVFLGSASGIANGNPLNAHAQLESDQANALLGWSVASAGDVNADGYADVIAGAWQYGNGQAGEGAAFVFLGGASGMQDGNPGNAHAQLESDQVDANLGFGVASAGDVNGDGFSDVIVGAPSYTSGHSREGAAFVFLGSASGVADGNPGNAHAQLESDQASAELGVSVASAGDVDGDGYADVIVGADAYDNGEINEGAAFVFLGSASGMADGNPANAHAQLESDLGGTLSALSVASAGDVNGDGFADVIVGAHQYDSGQTDEGAAFVHQGGGNRDGRPVLARQKRGDGSGIPVQPWGGSYAGFGFAAELRANHPQGSGRVKAEIEACPLAVPFGDASCAGVLTPTWIDVDGATPDVTISQILTGLEANALYRWRARVLHAPATGPIPSNPAHGPWRRPGAQSVEADVRVVPEPEALLALASGALLLGALARRRAALAEARPTTRRFTKEGPWRS